MVAEYHLTMIQDPTVLDNGKNNHGTIYGAKLVRLKHQATQLPQQSL